MTVDHSDLKQETQDWEQFVNACKTCRRCVLSQSRHHTVIWRGAVSAPLMIIGEGPGADEDASGIPFVGAAGKLLDLLLTAYDIKPDIYHICNIVKCRPPQNRVPTPDEAKACRPLLARQFQFVQPKAIILLGATAYKYFTGGSEGISKIRGQWIEKNGYFILPTYHPAYILRNNNERVRLWDDIGLARQKLEALGCLEPLVHQPDMPQGRH
ncbi:MAG: uracil-DNA glycosylase [Ruminococcaceae bacterium]|jgi:DNA polymerase|nr:uracil-DNA glycosylase [Oscillospiraceae bacterium]